MARAFLFNYCMLYPYEVFKENCYNVFGDVWVNAPLAITAASLIATSIVLPVDNLKTRMQNVYQDSSLNRYKNYEKSTIRFVGKIL